MRLRYESIGGHWVNYNDKVYYNFIIIYFTLLGEIEYASHMT